LIILSSSYFLGIFWRIIVRDVIDWENNDQIDVFNGYDTFYSLEDYGFVETIDCENIHEADNK
jgi:hypothetical protein